MGHSEPEMQERSRLVVDSKDMSCRAISDDDTALANAILLERWHRYDRRNLRRYAMCKMKTIIWLSTIIGISPVVILSLVASLVAFASKGQHSNGAGSVTHYYASTVFLEIGSIKFAVKPAILP